MGSLANLRDQADNKEEAPKPAVPRKPLTPNFYCLGRDHHPSLVTEERFFYWDEGQPGCPVCPICQKQVNAQGLGYNAKGQPQIPTSLLSLAPRIGEPV